MSLVNKEAPHFIAKAVFNNEFTDVDLAKYRGKWVVLFFYPLDFTFVCPTEIVAMSDNMGEFKKRGTEVIGMSTDSEFSHSAWINIPRDEGGLGELNYPLASDFTKKIAESYGVLLPEGMSLRATFIIDPEGIVKFSLTHDLSIGRNVSEIIRNLDALQFARKNEQVCPAGWMPGQATITPDLEKSKEFFKNLKFN